MKKKSLIFMGSALALLSIGTSACGSESSKDTASSSSSSSKVTKKKTIEFYKIGDTVKVGKVTYTLKSIKTTTYRNEFADEKPKYVIEVTYHVKNNSKDEDLPVGTDLNVYSPTNTKLKIYPIQNTTVDSIAPGKEADVTTGFGTNKLGQFELHFEPLASFDTKPAKFKATVNK